MIQHQAFPHFHHQHEDSHSLSDIAYSDEHHHHDDGSQENEDSNYSFFGFIMDKHLHSSATSDIVLLNRNTIEKQTDVNETIADSSVDTPIFYSRLLAKTIPYLSFPDYIFQSISFPISFTGPPILG